MEVDTTRLEYLNARGDGNNLHISAWLSSSPWLPPVPDNRHRSIAQVLYNALDGVSRFQGAPTIRFVGVAMAVGRDNALDMADKLIAQLNAYAVSSSGVKVNIHCDISTDVDDAEIYAVMHPVRANSLNRLVWHMAVDAGSFSYWTLIRHAITGVVRSRNDALPDLVLHVKPGAGEDDMDTLRRRIEGFAGDRVIHGVSPDEYWSKCSRHLVLDATVSDDFAAKWRARMYGDDMRDLAAADFDLSR